MNPFARRSSNCFFNSSSSSLDSRYGGREGGVCPGSKSIEKSTGRMGGSPEGKSSGKTSMKLLSTEEYGPEKMNLPGSGLLIVVLPSAVEMKARNISSSVGSSSKQSSCSRDRSE